MSKERNGLQMALGKDVLGDRVSLKRAVLVAIYFSMPSNQNGRDGSSNVIPQKIIPWGDNAEPRVYISPYTLKRNIRNYWIKQGLPVGYRESAGLVKEVEKDGKVGEVKFYYYLDYDLFGWVKASGNQSLARPGPINTWGAVSMETLHDFIDFNTSIKNANEGSEGGGIFNRSISKEFYFTSFSINPDLIGVDIESVGKGKNTKLSAKYIGDDSALNSLYPKGSNLAKRNSRLKLFLEAVKYAMQKDFGPRDRPVCVFAGVAIADKHYPTVDKDLFALIGKEDGITIEDGIRLKFGPKAIELLKKEKVKVYHLDKYFVEGEGLSTVNIDTITNELFDSNDNSKQSS